VNTYETLTIDVEDDGVGILTLNRPDKRNAMSPQLHRDMVAALEEIRYDPAVRVLVITGAGPAFCAGMDLKKFFAELGDKPAEFDTIYRMATEWRGRTLRYFPKPTIAMINGFCFGGAFSIVEGCDLAIAAEEATFGLSEINFGAFPGGSVSKSLANLLRPRDALFYALTGRSFDGKVAADIGLVNYAVPLASLRDDVLAVARDISRKNSHAATVTKDAYRHSLDMGWEASISYTSALGDTLARSQAGTRHETRKGVESFLNGDFRPGLEDNPALSDV
jgi:trans-feruloyl-CoA hydratase/vanillin synthase